MRGSGQIAQRTRDTIDIIRLSLKAWQELDRRVFQAAWMICGYTSTEELSQFDSQLVNNAMDLSAAQSTLHDMFSKYSKEFVPQLCTAMEWQIKASHEMYCNTLSCLGTVTCAG